MAVLQIAVGSAPGSGGTDTATLSGVTAGSTLVAFIFDGTRTSGATYSVADGQGSYTAQGSAVGTTDSVQAQAFTLVNANSGTHAAVLSISFQATDAAFIILVELSAPTSSSVSGSNAAAQAAPGTGTDALSSGTVTVTGSATLLVCSVDTHVVLTADAPAIGTGFTSVSANSNGVIGSWRVSSKSVGSNTAGTATAIVGGDNFATIAVAILEPASGSVPRLTTLGVG